LRRQRQEVVAVVPEAKVEGGVPQDAGWFVLNARDARWLYNELGGYCPFEGRDEARFPQLGINLSVLPPGEPMTMYHGEAAEEAFLVLKGECLLIVEGEERPLGAWDFFHCPPWTEHAIVGAGDGPSVVLAVGVRGKEGLRYPANETAVKHGAGVREETESGAEAYAAFSEPKEGPAPEL
jgi:uncharacterized cupin superfamily protein